MFANAGAAELLAEAGPFFNALRPEVFFGSAALFLATQREFNTPPTEARPETGESISMLRPPPTTHQKGQVTEFSVGPSFSIGMTDMEGANRRKEPLELTGRAPLPNGPLQD